MAKNESRETCKAIAHEVTGEPAKKAPAWQQTLAVPEHDERMESDKD